MTKIDSGLEDKLRPEYDLRGLQVRKVGPNRPGFAGFVKLAPDVARGVSQRRICE